MNQAARIGSGILFAAAVVAGTARAEGEAPARARKILADFQDAVVHVKIAVKQIMSMGGQERPAGDSQLEVTGTVIDPSGLIVISESDIDPMGLLQVLGGGMMGGLQFKSEVGDVKLVLKDGKEVPADLVLRDKDLDLAFIAPKEPDLGLVHVPFEKQKDLETFDELFYIGRLGRNLDRTPVISAGRVGAVVRKPRTFYVCNDAYAAMSGTGCPVFNQGGKPVGLFVRRRGPAAAGGGSSLSGVLGSLVPVILPGEDVMEVAQQALAEAKKRGEK